MNLKRSLISICRIAGSTSIGRSNLAQHSKQTYQGLGFLLECRPVHAGEPGPPLRGVRSVEIFVENQHELSLCGLILAQAITKQRNDAGGLADSSGTRGFVHSANSVCRWDVMWAPVGCDAGGVAAQGFRWVSFRRNTKLFFSQPNSKRAS